MIQLIGTIDFDWQDDQSNFFDKLGLINVSAYVHMCKYALMHAYSVHMGVRLCQFNPQLTYLDCLLKVDSADLWWLNVLLPLLNLALRLFEFWLTNLRIWLWYQITHRNANDTTAASSVSLIEALKPTPLLKAGMLRSAFFL